MDSIAVLPTVFDLHGIDEYKNFTYNDTNVTSKLHRCVAKVADQMLGKKYHLPPSTFSVTSDSLTRSLAGDIKYLLDGSMPEAYKLSNGIVDSLNTHKYPYVLIHYMEGKFQYPNMIKKTNSWRAPLSSAIFLATGGTVMIYVKIARVNTYQLLYDVKNQKVLYYYRIDEYTESVFNYTGVQNHFKGAFKKLYYR